MILAIEGAPGVGKSTIAAGLSNRGAYVVPEANVLFSRPDPEPYDWYCDSQNARWDMAQAQSTKGVLAVLDGDPFQPLWFGWIYRDGGWPTMEMTAQFYRRRIAQGRIAFPDLYVFVHIAEAERCARMVARERARGSDEEKAQRKTAHYARMVEPQKRFFGALGKRFPGSVLFVEAAQLEKSIAAILAEAAALRGVRDGLEQLAFIVGWLTNNAADCT